MQGVFCRDHPDVRLWRRPGGLGWVHEDGEYCASSWPIYLSVCVSCRVSGRDIYDLDKAQQVLRCRSCGHLVRLPTPVLAVDEPPSAPTVTDLPAEFRSRRTAADWPEER